jgi:N-methylhydantoinase A
LAGLAAASVAEPPSVGRRSIRLVELPNVSVDCLVRARHSVKPGETIAGPAIIEQMDSTSLVLRGQVAVADPSGNLVISEIGS